MKKRSQFVPLIVGALSLLGWSLAAQDPAALKLAADEAKGELVFTLGPLHLPAHASHHDVAQVPLESAEVPFEGWLHGFRVEMVTADGQPVSPTVIHHINLIDLDRRALLAPIVNRVLAVGSETKPASLPRSFGYPVHKGQRLGIFTGFHNPTANDYHAAYMRLILTYTPAPASPAPRSIYSLWFDAKLDPGVQTDFDLPPGESSKWQDFTAPISGSVLGLGGHLHDYGVRLTLEDRTTGTMLYDVAPDTDEDGRVLAVPAKLYLQEPLHLEAEHVYRITAYYRNPTSETIAQGGMGTIGGVFVPDADQSWPLIDEHHPEYVADLRGLKAGHGGGAHHGEQHHD
jgi:hypothetical protein